MKSVRKKTFLLTLKKQDSICGFAVCSDEKRSKKFDILLVFETEGVLSVFLVEHSICAPFVFGKILVLLFLLN